MVPFGPVWSGEMDINDTKWVKTTSKMFNLFPNIFISNIHISTNDIKIRKFDFSWKRLNTQNLLKNVCLCSNHATTAQILCLFQH